MEVTITNLGGAIRILDVRDDPANLAFDVLKDGLQLFQFGDVCRIQFISGRWIDILYTEAEVIGFGITTIPSDVAEFYDALYAVLVDYNGGGLGEPYNFSFKEIALGATVTIPIGQQMIVMGDILIDGDLVIDGELVLTDLPLDGTNGTNGTDGTNGTNGIDGATGAGGTIYYMNGGTAGSVGGYYELSKTAVIGTGVDFTLAGTGSVVKFITNANDPAVDSIPGGNWNFEVFVSMSSNGGVPKVQAKVYQYDISSTTFVLIGTSIPVPVITGTVITAILIPTAVALTTVDVLDQFAVEFLAVDNVPGRDMTIHTQDSHICEVTTTIPTGIQLLNGSAKSIQTFATGTSGTDFNIVTVAGVHTFNIPNWSATNRGLPTPAQFAALLAVRIWKSVVTSSAVTGTTANTVVATQAIQANELTVLDVFDVKTLVTKVGGAGVTTLRVYVNATADLAGSPVLIMTCATTAISHTFMGTDRTGQIKSATNTTTLSPTANIADDAIVGNGVATASNIDWTALRYFVFAIQNGAVGDSTTLQYYTIVKK